MDKRVGDFCIGFGYQWTGNIINIERRDKKVWKNARYSSYFICGAGFVWT